MEETAVKNFVVQQGQGGIRIDKYLGMCQEEFSRSYLQKLIADNAVRMDGKAVAAKEKTKEGIGSGAGKYSSGHPV